jgi:glyoxylase I family protein
VERVTGIGGVFFRCRDPERLAAWYEQHLGLNCSPQGDVVWEQEAGPTVWVPFPQDSAYLGSREQQVMVNFRVRDLDAMLVQLHEAGIDPEGDVVEQAGVGRFAHFRDPAGTRLELWEPANDR